MCEQCNVERALSDSADCAIVTAYTCGREAVSASLELSEHHLFSESVFW